MTTNAISGAVRVRAASGDYFVRCQRGLLRKAAREIARLGKFSSVHIVTSPRVWGALGKPVQRGLLAQKGARHH